MFMCATEEHRHPLKKPMFSGWKAGRSMCISSRRPEFWRGAEGRGQVPGQVTDISESFRVCPHLLRLL